MMRDHIKNTSARYIFALLLVAGLAGTYYFYRDHLLDLKIEAIVKQYDPVSNLAKIKETDHTKIEEMVKHIDAAIKDYPDSQTLREVQAKLLFLEFEEGLSNRPIEQWLEEAGNQVDTIEGTLRNFPPNQCEKNKDVDEIPRVKRNAIQQVCELLELARVVIRFKQFKQTYPDLASSTAQPSLQDVNEIIDLREPLMRNLKNNQFILKTLYTNFQRLVRETEDDDLRLANRWKEAIEDAAITTDTLPLGPESAGP
jgi:hypothetical protein